MPEQIMVQIELVGQLVLLFVVVGQRKCWGRRKPGQLFQSLLAVRWAPKILCVLFASRSEASASVCVSCAQQ